MTFGTVISAVILREKSKIVRENFPPALEMQFGRFIEISKNRCATTNIHWNILLGCSFDGTNCRFVDYNFETVDTSLLVTQKVHDSRYRK